jgi:hypothetical protein
MQNTPIIARHVAKSDAVRCSRHRGFTPTSRSGVGSRRPRDRLLGEIPRDYRDATHQYQADLAMVTMVTADNRPGSIVNESKRLKDGLISGLLRR